MNIDDTIVAVSSPPGAAPRGIVRVCGPDTVRIVGSLFSASDGRALDNSQDNCLIAGSVRLEPGSLPATAYVFRGPRSYTGQDLIELHLLGAPGVLALLVEGVLAAGARRAEPGEFTARAYLAGRMDIAQVHGVAAMIAARSDLQLQAAENLLHGALSRTAHEAREELADLLSLVEGAMDFADEPIEFITPRQLRERLGRVVTSLQRAVDAGLRAERWGQLPRILLAGPPNVGKSSLMNRLTGTDRAICAPVPGTTRDVLSAPLKLDEVDCLLLDVAGTDQAGSAMEADIQAAGRRALAEADVILVVCDASRDDWLGAAVPPWMHQVDRRPAIVVGNKADLLSDERRGQVAAALAADARRPRCLTSAVTGEGCDRLRTLIEDGLGNRTPDQGGDSTIALMAEHREALLEAVAAGRRAVEIAGASGESLADAELVASELHEAAERLGTLVGRDLPDEMLGRIFSRFCIGK